jgi:glycosyltransferase involved in cell wall biosynthesis
MKDKLDAINPVGIYIVTESMLGYNAVKIINKLNEEKLEADKIPFVTCYHTQWPEYCADAVINKASIFSESFRKKIAKKVESKLYTLLQKFHNNASATFVTTESMRNLLQQKGFTKIKPWSNAVDTDNFSPELRTKPDEQDYIFKDPVTGKTASRDGGKCKILGYVGRVASHKNLKVLFDLSENIDKSINGGNYKIVIIGNAASDQELNDLREKYPNIIFTGPKQPHEVPPYFANFDVFAFPSLTDTFGMVQIEALSCGTPVAAYNVQGPKDIIKDGVIGGLENDTNKGLNDAIKKALQLNRDDCRRFIEVNDQYTWKSAAKQFADVIDKIKESTFARFN